MLECCFLKKQDVNRSIQCPVMLKTAVLTTQMVFYPEM